MNIPQQNRKTLILERLNQLNNYEDCDVIQEAINEIEKSENSVDLIAAISYAISAVEYRGRKHAAWRLQELSDEIASYESLFQAVQNKNQVAIDWWNKQAEAGNRMRII